METTIRNIRLFLISPSPRNPRKTFDGGELQELADNIGRQGLLQPITVRPMRDARAMTTEALEAGAAPDSYEIVCGERRYRACSLLGTESVACIVRAMSDDEAFDAMITENLQRKDIDPMEEAEALRMLQERGDTVQELSLRFGKSQSYIRSRLQLTGLVHDVKKLLSKKAISISGALMLSRLDETGQQEYFERNYAELEEEDYHSETLEEIEDFCDDYCMNLWNAPFMDGGSLKEEWNPEGRMMRRCDRCPGCSLNQQSLFPEMERKEPRCTLRECYEKKCDAYYEWWLGQNGRRIVGSGSQPKSGDLCLLRTKMYNATADAKQDKLARRLTGQGFRMFSPSDLGNQLWRDEDGIKAVGEGKAVEVIDLSQMAEHRQLKPRYFMLKNESEEAQQKNQDMAYRLAGQLRQLRAREKSQTCEMYKAIVTDSGYTERKGKLELWEENMIIGIIVTAMNQLDQMDIAPANHVFPTYDDVVDFKNKMREEHDESWKRKAIAHFMSGYQKESFLKEAAMRIDGDRVKEFINEQYEKNFQREQDIVFELKDMGFDEWGNKV